MDEDIKVIFTLDKEQPIDCVFRIDAITFDYETLDKKPQINGVTLIGDKSSSDLHLASEQDIVNVNDRITNVSEYFEEDIERVENNINTLDEKVDGINANLTQQIEETQQDVNNKYNELVNDIDELSTTVDNNYTTLDTRITNNANAITQEATNRQNADDALSDRIDAVESRGRFLALWNATTGLPESTPQITPYTYKTGDYYIVDAVGEINYRPTGTEFVEGQPSTEIETEELTTDDVYYYDGAVWRLQVNHGKTVSFGNLTGQPSDNTALKNALDSKQATLVSGTNIKTLNNESLLGEGNIDITSAQWGNISGTLANQTDLKNVLDLKQNITDNNLVTTNKTVVGAVNELDSKIKEIELYKTPNVLIQGEPTINNGQVTGFSKTAYLILPFEFNVGDRAFELTYAFRTGSDVTTAQNLFGSKLSIASYIQNGKLTIRVSSNGTSWDILDLITSLNIQPNTTYYIKLIFNKLSYEVKSSADGAEYSRIGYVVDTRAPFAGDVFIGIGNNTNNPFLGMINLHKWELKYNNSVFWEGMDDAGLATRADISLSNLDEQGQAKLGTQVIIRRW